MDSDGHCEDVEGERPGGRPYRDLLLEFNLLGKSRYENSNFTHRLKESQALELVCLGAFAK